MSVPWLSALVRSLGAERIETPISWVLLAGDYAYKIKRPVRLPFLDYGSVVHRRHFCTEEVRLNGRLAPGLYLGVAAITGPEEAPEIDGTGPVLDYAVRMRRFPPGSLFSERLQTGALDTTDVDALADLLARFHAAAPVAPADIGYGSAERRIEAAFAALHGAIPAADDPVAALLRAWMQAEGRRLQPHWKQRQTAGRIRECHGDLHLANVVRLPDGSVAAFDGIEFDPGLRWIDVIDDVAFTVMDLDAHGRRDLAFRLLNQWLDQTGDHDALPALRLAVVYRALVRAQVERLRGGPDSAPARRYRACAVAWTRPAERRLTIMYGLPGSGKSWWSQRLLERDGAIRVRSDVERKRLFALPALADSRAAGLDLYTAAAGEATYTRLLDLARDILGAGYPVILDAAFLRHAERQRAQALAEEAGVPFTIVPCEAPVAVLEARLQLRRGDPSEADVQVLHRLHAAAESLTPEELALVIRPDAP